MRLWNSAVPETSLAATTRTETFAMPLVQLQAR